MVAVHKESLPATRVQLSSRSRLHHSCDQVAIVHKLDGIAASCLWFILVLTPFILKRTPDQVLSRNKLERFRNLGSFTIFQGSGHISLSDSIP